MLSDVGDDRIAAFDFFKHTLHGFEHGLGPESFGFLLDQFLSEHVQDGLDVVIRVEEAVVLVEQDFLKLGVVNDIPVVGHDDPVGRVDEEGLGVFSPSSSDGRVAGVAQADVASQADGMLGSKDISNQAVSLFGVETAVIGDDARRILASVLDGKKALIQIFEDIIVSVYPDDTAHIRPT